MKVKTKLIKVTVFVFLQMLSTAGFGDTGYSDPIRLMPLPTAIVPEGFYIKSVIDARSNKQAIARLAIRGGNNTHTIQFTDLHGGGHEAIRNFFLQSVVQHSSHRPLNIVIRECEIAESYDGSRVSGNIKVALEFELVKASGNISLTQYRTNARYTRAISNLIVIEPTFRHLLTSSLEFINDWMKKEAGKNLKLATGVEISFSEFLKHDSDTIYYDAARPLMWDDFKAIPLKSRFAAEIFPSWGYDQTSKLEKEIIHVELALKVYVVKSASWVKPGHQNRYSLNHEQRHFDLVKLVTEDFKKKLRSETLTVDNYEGIINYEYLEFFRAMNKIQEQYDLETSHGMNSAAQDHWNRKIDKRLGAINLEH